MVLKSSIRSSASPCSAVFGLSFWNSDHVVLKLSIRSSALLSSAAIGLDLWTSKGNETRKCDGTDRTDGNDGNDGKEGRKDAQM